MKRLVEIDDATHAVVPRKVTSEIVRAWNGGDPTLPFPASYEAECQADWDRMIAVAPAVPDAQTIVAERDKWKADYFAADKLRAENYETIKRLQTERDTSGSKADNRFAAIGELVRTQDNRITESPIFAVQQKREICHVEDDCEYRWVTADDYERVDAAEADALERDYQLCGDIPETHRRVGVREIWEFVTACFSEQGCKDYIAVNGHNLKEPRIYAYGSFRNSEWQFIRNQLLAAPRPRKKEIQS